MYNLGSGTLPTRRKVKDTLVSPSSNAVKAVQQLENDEAFARRLQVSEQTFYWRK